MFQTIYKAYGYQDSLLKEYFIYQTEYFDLINESIRDMDIKEGLKISRKVQVFFTLNITPYVYTVCAENNNNNNGF